MSTVNKIILIGNLGKDPEVKTFQNGNKVCNFSIATSESWKDKETGERRERTEWHTVSIFAEGLVGVAEKYLRKGSKVYVEGQLETRKWQDRDGNDRYSTEVVLRPYRSELVLLGDKQNGGQRDQRETQRDDRPQDDGGGGYKGGGDSIPF